jgi:sugar/nucleoside kinase (ribokinase family)
MLGTSTPCRFLFRSAGGVGRNLADVLRKLLPDELYGVNLISVVGDDPEGQLVLEKCKSVQIGTRHIQTLSIFTAHNQTKLYEEDSSTPFSITSFFSGRSGTGDIKKTGRKSRFLREPCQTNMVKSGIGIP